MMESAKVQSGGEPLCLIPKNIPEEVTDSDREYFFRVVSVDLNEEQRSRILKPPRIFPRQEAVLAVHWHPESVPMDLIAARIDAMFPHRRESLIIPTQHNEILNYDAYSGVEVDSFSGGFNQKVQLLLHFENANAEKADTLKKMLAHTFKYRSSQLYHFIHTITRPVQERMEEAARRTGANDALIRFVQVYVRKIESLIDAHYNELPPPSMKNKLLRNFFDCLRPAYGDTLIDRAQTFLTAVKKEVKAHFPLRYFYRTSEIIEEARSLNAGIVIPHPEQFWPVLLAEYDVDGIEVWNPQSQRYSEFLIGVLNKKNRHRGPSHRRLLVFMGDDTHMAEKTRPVREQNPEKASREIGFQPAWDDLTIRKTLIMAGCSRKEVIREYKSRLAG